MDGPSVEKLPSVGTSLSDDCLKGILGSLPLAVCVCDSDGLITYYNQRAASLWGRTPELLSPRDKYCGSHKLMTSEGDVVPHQHCGVAEALRSGQKFENVQALISRPDGEVREIVANVFPLTDDDGRIIGAVNLISEKGDFKDIDAATVVAEQPVSVDGGLQSPQQHSEQRVSGKGAPVDTDRIKTEFIATLAHELRNSLVPLTTGIELLDMEDVAEEVSQKARSRMARQLKHIARLTDDLNDYSAIALGKISLARETIDLREVCEQAVELVQPLVDKAGQELRVRLDSQQVLVQADQTRMIQVVSNLLANATKFTRDGGRLELSCESSTELGVVKIKDDGIGIEKKDLGLIFELFSQTDSRLSNRESGMGIGLAVSRALVQMQGGEIQVESEGRDRGSEFTVMMPLSSGNESVAAKSTAVPGSACRYKVLVLDDNEAVATTLKHVLEAIGHEVETAADGQQGIVAAKEFRPDVILCDIAMPEMSGFEFADRIRKFDWAAGIRLIACSGTAGIKPSTAGRESVFDSVLTKPVDLKTLAAAISE